jgi:hypothetical protein
MAELRALRDRTTARLRELVGEHDLRVTLAKVKRDHPALGDRIARRVEVPSIPSGESFGKAGF